MTVSYTHLDVYKRQGKYHAGNQQHAGAFFADVAYIRFFVEVVADTVTADVMKDSIAVSINMFADDFAEDVYKRQPSVSTNSAPKADMSRRRSMLMLSGITMMAL